MVVLRTEKWFFTTAALICLAQATLGSNARRRRRSRTARTDKLHDVAGCSADSRPIADKGRNTTLVERPASILDCPASIPTFFAHHMLRGRLHIWQSS